MNEPMGWGAKILYYIVMGIVVICLTGSIFIVLCFIVTHLLA